VIIRFLLWLVLSISCALLLAACGKSGSNTTNSVSISGGEKIGVPACDDYLAKLEACISNKMPEKARERNMKDLEGLRKTILEMAAKDRNKAATAAICRQASEVSRENYKKYDCDF
jgi:hypothetical protein